MLSKILTYFLLVKGTQGFKSNLGMKEGHCPYKPGDIKVDMVAKINAELLHGTWINIYDRKHLNDHMKCVSVAFEDYHEDRDEDAGPQKNFPTYSLLNISKNPVKKPVEGEEEAEVDTQESYNIREGMQVNFAYGHKMENLDTSIGMIEHQHWGDYDVEASEFEHDGKKEKEFCPFLWDSQYKRYA